MFRVISVGCSVDSSGEEEVLDDGHHLDLAEVKEQLVKLLLVGAVEDQVGPEDEDACSQDWQDLKSLKADNPIQQQVDLVDLQSADEAKVDPWEGRLERLDAKLIHVVAHFWLVHLQQVFEQLAKGDYGLGLRRDGLQLAEVLAVHRTENEVALFLGVTNIAEWCAVTREMLAWEDAGLREDSAWLLISALGNDWSVWALLHQIKHLTITEKEHDARLHHVLEDEVLVIVANFINVAHDEVIKSSLPLCSQLIGLSVIINLFLCNFSVENLFVHASSQTWRNSSLGVLNQEWLIVFLQKSLSNKNALIDKGFLLVHADLAHLHIELDQAPSDSLQRTCLELQLDRTPG